MGIEDEIKAAWDEFRPPYYGDDENGDWWPRAGPPLIRVPRKIKWENFIVTAQVGPVEMAPPPIEFSFVRLFNTEWTRERFAIYGECEGVKIQVGGPDWPEGLVA